LTSPPTGQALATDAAQGFVGAHRVVDAERDTVGIAEVELFQIAGEVTVTVNCSRHCLALH